MLTERNPSTSFVAIAVSLLLMLLFAVPVFAVQRARESHLNRGWQIWIEAADFDRRDDNEIIKIGAEVPELRENAPDFLAQDIIIAPSTGGFLEYDFESPEDGEAYGFCSGMDFRGGDNSWFISLNSPVGEQNWHSRTRAGWTWETDEELGSRFPRKLIKGKNTVRVTAREAKQETLMDIICVSTVPFIPSPTDDDFMNAELMSADEAVQPEGKLATMWGTIKGNF